MSRRVRHVRPELGALFGWVAACSFDTSGLTESMGMSIGGSASDPTETEAAATEPTTAASDDMTGADASADVTGTESSQDGCSGSSSCGAPAPPGWSGPFAIATASPPNPTLGCAMGWTEHVYASRGLQAAPAECTCQCVPSGGSCNVTVAYYSDAGCMMATEGGASAGACDSMSTQSGHGYVRATGVTMNTTCTPMPSTVVPPVAWGEAAVLCAPPNTPACDEGPCLPAVPTGFDGRWCVYAEGEESCPAGDYSETLVMHRGATDTRECSPCGCNVQGTPSCNGSFTEFVDSFCVVGIDEIPVDGACHQSLLAGESSWSVAYDGTPPTFACADNAPMPGGTASAIDAITICCAA